MATVDSFQFLYREMSRSCNPYFETLALVGAIYTASRAVILLRECCSLVRVHFLPRIIPNKKKLSQRFGDWAIVYGASEPVAKAYAEELARHGVSIIFVTQSEASVRDIAALFSQSYGVETVVLLADFSLNQAASNTIKEAMKGREIGFLVNCMESLDSPQSLIEMPELGLLDLVNKNVAVATLMARLVLPGMLERRRGAVVNISSGACCKPLPGRVTQTAFAGYMDHLSRALHLEYSGKGIFVQSLIPFQIREQPPSSSSPSSRLNWFEPQPEVYARHAISTLGVSNRTTGYWPHTLQYGLMRRVPDFMWVLGSRVWISLS
ncbi:inactive hydroxysteroid dehydrogenase-like protein 1 [Pseudochaenichthys georgianus]|uniref:inactive hydroxysteroid dehydrogenase-like protein 1 n=1 Tax=Pseudochaenichthys georgianus TaxID=52239 RepID=UPI00146E68B6|nr:inactive hydroxysteroid dehydrogenase-like protein 1 [Pseudochaenichthys georgianus]